MWIGAPQAVATWLLLLLLGGRGSGGAAQAGADVASGDRNHLQAVAAKRAPDAGSDLLPAVRQLGRSPQAASGGHSVLRGGV